ncbi:MAG: pyridine nucleotide-disulfide oxidoreductase [Desulfovibrionaceae bacterium CG1_02_65_16]|nr:MAG: pyridine nucleotide-disulfide oxidoreductase [Desulfovibrionaceae bacterium CG1_02_65_16]
MPQRVVIIGAVALGPKAAARYKRLDPDAEVTLLDRGRDISYGGCGIPFYVSGDVSDASELQTTAFHMLRDAEFFRKTKGVNVRTQTEALAIDRANKTVRVRHLPTGREEDLPYDKLVLATGSRANRLSAPGAELPGVLAVDGMQAAREIRAQVSGGGVSHAVVVGAGFIGLEMAVALTDLWGVETTVVEFRDQVLPGVIGPNLARMVQRDLEQHGVRFLLGQAVQTFEADEKGHLAAVATPSGRLEAELAIVAVGVTPNDELARAAGLTVGRRGGIVVDAQLRTSDPDIFAGGDCVVLPHALTGAQTYLPLGSLANRQGRVIGTNLASDANPAKGRDPAATPPVVGAWCVKLFDRAAAGAGLTLASAKAVGFDAVCVHMGQVDRAHFHPDKGFMSLELIVERGAGRILGMQGVAANGDTLVGKVDVVAALLPSSPTVETLAGLELAYSPPFSAALDILNVLGGAAQNILEGRVRGVQVDEFAALWAERDKTGAPLFLDCRETADASPFMTKYPDDWRNIPQGELADRLAELPRDRELVLVCNTGARSYEAFITLAHAGFTNVVSVEGGMTAIVAAGLGI